MAADGLTAFWISPPFLYAPLGFGITARSLDEALAIVRAFGYGDYLPPDPSSLRVTAGVTVAHLDQSNVAPRMGPIAVRGMWYPFVTVGVPPWAEERLLNR